MELCVDCMEGVERASRLDFHELSLESKRSPFFLNETQNTANNFSILPKKLSMAAATL